MNGEELTPEQRTKYIARDEALSITIEYMKATSQLEIDIGPLKHFRKMEFIADFQTTATVELKGAITMEAMDGVLAYVSYAKTLLEKALEASPGHDGMPLSPARLREELMRIAVPTEASKP